MTTLLICAAIFVVGVVCLVGAIQLKIKNKIPKWMLKGVELTSKSNIEGFANAMWAKTMAAGGILICYAAYRATTIYIPEIVFSNWAMAGVVAFLMAYMALLTNAKRDFLGAMH